MATGDTTRVLVGGRPRAAQLVTIVGDGGTNSSEEKLDFVGYEKVSEPETSTALSSIPSGAKIAKVQNNGSQSVRYLGTGAVVTTTTGLRILPNEEVSFGGNLANLRFIRETAGVTLDVAYYG